MKRRLRALLIAAACAAGAAGAAACGDDGNSVSGEADGTMSATVADSFRWEATKSVVATLKSGILTMTGTEKSGRVVKITLLGVVLDEANPDVTQTFNLTSVLAVQTGYAQYSASLNDNFNTTLTGGSGAATITHLTATRAVGTFTFSGVRTVISGGLNEQDQFRRLSGGLFDVRLRP